MVDFQNQLLEERFRTVLGDIHYLRRVYGDELSLKGRSNEITEDWLEFSNQRRIYDQIRFIDKFGNEQIRINFKNNQALLVDDFELQNKADRYYFFETKILENEAVFISPLDLNIEGSEIEKPYKPMLRFSTPVYDDNNDFQGAIVLNYLGNTFLDDFKDLAKGSEGAFALLNENGYWLSCKEENNEWGFMFDDKQDIRFSNLFPDEWQRIIMDQGQLVSEHGLFTFATVPLNQNFIKDALNPNEDIINHSDSKWYIVSFIDTQNPLAPIFWKINY